MARGVNKVILIGNLGDEPSYRQTSSGTAVVNISMVTNEMRRSMDTQQVTEFAEWHRVVMWGKLAEIAHQWLHKGSQIYVEGKLRTRSYTDKQNVKRTITEIVADEMQMLGGKNNSFQNDGQQASSAPSYQSAQPYQGGQQFRSDYNTQSAPTQQSPYGNSPMQNASPYGTSQAQPVQNQQSVYSQQIHSLRMGIKVVLDSVRLHHRLQSLNSLKSLICMKHLQALSMEQTTIFHSKIASRHVPASFYIILCYLLSARILHAKDCL